MPEILPHNEDKDENKLPCMVEKSDCQIADDRANYFKFRDNAWQQSQSVGIHCRRLHQ